MPMPQLSRSWYTNRTRAVQLRTGPRSRAPPAQSRGQAGSDRSDPSGGIVTADPWWKQIVACRRVGGAFAVVCASDAPVPEWGNSSINVTFRPNEDAARNLAQSIADLPIRAAIVRLSDMTCVWEMDGRG